MYRLLPEVVGVVSYVIDIDDGRTNVVVEEDVEVFGSECV